MRKLPHKDVVIIGLGWTGSIMANELTDEGLDVVAIERGPWRDAVTDFPPNYDQDELRYRIRHELFLRPRSYFDRTDGAGNAGLRLATRRRTARGRRHLYQEQLGLLGARGLSRHGSKDAGFAGVAQRLIYAAREESPEPAIENRDTWRAELTPTSATTLPA